jgi:hypothetical protein
MVKYRNIFHNQLVYYFSSVQRVFYTLLHVSHILEWMKWNFPQKDKNTRANLSITFQMSWLIFCVGIARQFLLWFDFYRNGDNFSEIPERTIWTPESISGNMIKAMNTLIIEVNFNFMPSILVWGKDFFDERSSFHKQFSAFNALCLWIYR